MTTFSQIWNAIRLTWHSRPFALILPIAALAWYWWTHGHALALATEKDGGSLPTWQEFVAGAALLTTKWERVTYLFFGPPQPAGDGGAQGSAKVGVVLALVGALAVGSSGCGHIGPAVDNIVHEVEVCAGPACADAAKQAIPKISEIIMCDAMAGFSPAALPACASAALAGWAKAAGPDGWRVIACVVNALEHDLTKPPELRARARAARPLAARMAAAR